MQQLQEEKPTEVLVFNTETANKLELEDVEEWQLDMVSDRRRHPRFPVTVLHILEMECFRELDVVDISSQGICILRKGWRFIPGGKIVFDIIYRDRFVIKNAKALILRVDDESIGCKFLNISERVGAKLIQFAIAAT